MTQEQHPITPPVELVEQWHMEATGGFRTSDIYIQDIATQAARWGADQELDACCKWLRNCLSEELHEAAQELRTARRPKPPSLKEQALETLRSMQIEPVILDGINVNKEVMDKYDIIRRALESLPD